MMESFFPTLILIAISFVGPELRRTENPWPKKPVPKSEAFLLAGRLYSAESIHLEQAIQDAQQFLSESGSAAPAEMENLHAALLFARQTRQPEYFGRGEDVTTTGVSQDLENIIRLYGGRQFLLASKQLKAYSRGRKPDRVVAILYQGLCEQQLAIEQPSAEDRVKRLKKALAHFTNIDARHKKPYTYNSELVQARALMEKYRIHRSLWKHYKAMSQRYPRVRGNALDANSNLKRMKDCRAKMRRQFGDQKDTNGNLFTSFVTG